MGRVGVICLVSAALVVVFNVPGADSQAMKWGTCPTLTVAPLNPVQTNGDYLAGAAGRVWYVIQRSRSLLGYMRCMKITLTNHPTNNQKLSVDVEGVTPGWKPLTVHGEMTSTSTTFQNWNLNFMKTALLKASTTPYTVLGADVAGSTWAVLYSCKNVQGTSPGLYTESVFILSSTRFMDSALLTTAQAVLSTAGVTTSLVSAEQTYCRT